MIRRGDADDVDFLQVKNFAKVLGDVGGIVGLKATLFGGRVKTAAATLLHFLIAFPDIADGHGLNALMVVAKLGDGLEMFLAATADAQEADANAFISAEDPTGAGSR